MTFSKYFIPRFIALFSLTLFISCGSQKPMVTDVKVQTSYLDDDLYISVGANLSIGNIVLPQTSLPIYMPKTFEEIGSLSLTSSLGGQNYMEIDVNVSAVANLQAQEASLPNGSVLPLIANNQVIKIPISNGAELYLALADGVVAIGAAIPFKTLDAMGAKIGTSSLFPVFNIENVFGAAGIYTSSQPGKNGFGLFVDLSTVIDPIGFIDIGVADNTDLPSKSLVQTEQIGAQLDYTSIVPSSRKEEKMNQELYRLHKVRKRLELH